MTDILEYYLEAGKVHASAMKLADKIVKPNASILEIANKIEKHIIESGAGLAFPVNISVNHVAAHDTATVNDKRKIPRDSMVKIDVGVHVNGYIVDGAKTYVFNKKDLILKKVVQDALNNVVENLKPRSPISAVGEFVEEIVQQHDNINVIENLCGHAVEQFNLHAGVTIVNHKIRKFLIKSKDKFLPNHAYAIEPFVTRGKKEVVGISRVEIYALTKKVSELKITSKEKKRALEEIEKMTNYLPFAARWLDGILKKRDIYDFLDRMRSRRIIVGYPVLIEPTRKNVAQAEHTIFVTEDEILLLTDKKMFS